MCPAKEREPSRAWAQLTKCPRCGSTGPFKVNVYRTIIGYGSVEHIDDSGRAKWLEPLGDWEPYDGSGLGDALYLQCGLTPWEASPTGCGTRFQFNEPTVLDRLREVFAEVA
jgi:hypothetical protein